MDLKSSMAVTSIMAEMHNDALYYLSEARNTSDDFQKWRYYRTAIICFCISVEAALTQLVVKKLQEAASNLHPDDQTLLERLIDPDKADEKPPEKFTTVWGKITKFESLYNKQISTASKKPMFELSKFRNKIVHYTTGYEEKVYTESEKVASSAPDVVDDFLSEVFSIAGLPPGFEKNRTPNY